MHRLCQEQEVAVREEVEHPGLPEPTTPVRLRISNDRLVSGKPIARQATVPVVRISVDRFVVVSVV